MTKYVHTMNATFNIRRLGLNLYREILEKYKTVLGFWAIIILVYLLFWGLSLLFGSNVGTITRGSLVAALLQFYCFLVPFLLYKNETRHVEGILYGITPASTLEKTLTIFIMATLLFPALTAVLMISLDSLLAVIPTENGFTGHIWNTVFSSEKLLSGLVNLNPSPESKDMLDKMLFGIPTVLFSPYLCILLQQSMFIFFAMLFRTHKIAKTLLIFFGAGFVMSILTAILMLGVAGAIESGVFTMDTIDEETFLKWVMGFIRVSAIIWGIVLPIVFWVLTYLRIRRIQY